MKKILVTGGSGFLGNHLCRELVKNKNEVICLDDLSSGFKENINDLMKFSNFKFIFHDVTKPIEIEVDQIYNLACPASPVQYQKNPIKTTITSVLGTLNVLKLAKKNNAKVLQASTSEIYGNPKINPQNEQYWGNVNPIGVRSCYDEGKRCAETLCMDFKRQHSVDVKIIRIFNTYGPQMSQNDGRVVSNFIMQSLNNKQLTVYGNGEQTRSFCYVNDLISGFILAMNNNDVNGVLNLGNPEENRIIDIASLIIKMTNSNSKIKFTTLPEDDPVQRKPDISKAIDILKWSPKVNFKEGIKETIDWFNSKYNKQSI